VLALRINPETYLYPFIKRWPTPSLPAETLLVRRDGNDALCLNELQFRTNTALNLRFSLEHTNSAAVKAVLGQNGIVEARDYFGAPVLAALYAIPDSPWFLVTRMDTAKVYAPLAERLRLTILIGSLLLISTALGIGAIWRHQRVRFYKERYEMIQCNIRDITERKRAEEALHYEQSLMATLMDNLPDAVYFKDAASRFIRVNRAHSRKFGLSDPVQLAGQIGRGFFLRGARAAGPGRRAGDHPHRSAAAECRREGNLAGRHR